VIPAVKARAAALLAGVLAFSPSVLPAADWPRFRGPAGTGISAETDLPLRWSDGEGLLWKTELPGPGSSSPIVSAGKVFVTCYSGYGTRRGEEGERKPLRRVLCLDPASGKILWDKSLESKVVEAAFDGIGIPNHGYASSTPVADGERVYAFFGTAGVIAFDFEGREVWRAAIAPEPGTHNFGSASSPVLHKDLLIVTGGVECEAIVAYNRRDGKEAWRAPCKGYGGWWGTPVPVEVDGRTELLFSVPDEIWGLNPENGKLRWHARSFPERTICPSVVTAGGVAYAIGGRGGGAVAVRAGGRGDVTGSHVVWNKSAGSYVPSPVLVAGHLYWVNDRGIAFCLKADNGEQVFNERLGDSVTAYASLVAGDGKLYAVTRRKGTYVLEAAPKLRELAHNTFTGDDTDFNASPAVSDGRLYLRSNRFLYCVGKPKG
jgi:outer membrane protein assembly factor BamB